MALTEGDVIHGDSFIDTTSFNLIGDTENYFGTLRYDTGKVEYYGYNKDIKGSISTVIDENGDGRLKIHKEECYTQEGCYGARACN